MSGSPGVVLKSKFVMPGSKDFEDYVEYIDRDDVKRKVAINRSSLKSNDFQVFHSYMEYMGDEEKEGSLFTISKDELTDEEKIGLKEAFSVAQKNGSPMWQDVISFDNAWLEKNGLYVSETKELDEEKVRNVVRQMMGELLKSEKMEESAIWSASIHYNTDNIHVHVATVEPHPTRPTKRIYNEKRNQWETQYRAKRKQKTLDKMKSKVANTILDRSEQRNKIDGLIRGAVHQKKSKDVDLAVNRKTKKLFLKAIALMPDDKHQWQYGYQTINDARPYIDEIVDLYLETYHKDEMKELHHLLDEEVNVMKEMYGERSNYQKYKQTKLDDLKKRMGNAVIKEMKDYVKREQQVFHLGNRYSSAASPTRFKFQQHGELDRTIRNLNYHMRKTYDDYKLERDQEEFDRMLDGYER